MDAIALAVGEASIRDEDYFQQTCRKVKHHPRPLGGGAAGARLYRAAVADKLPCLSPTRTRKRRISSPPCAKMGIFIRYFKLPRIDNYLRITVGTDEQMDKLIAALKEIL